MADNANSSGVNAMVPPPVREADNEGFSRDRGFGLQVGAQSEVGLLKGDRDRAGVPGPANLSEAPPWKNLRSER